MLPHATTRAIISPFSCFGNSPYINNLQRQKRNKSYYSQSLANGPTVPRHAPSGPALPLGSNPTLSAEFYPYQKKVLDSVSPPCYHSFRY